MEAVSTAWGVSATRDAPGRLPPIVSGAASQSPAGTVLLLHGRNGAPDQPQIATMARAYLGLGWRVAAPELPNSAALPRSGPASGVTMTGQRLAAMEAAAWVRTRWPQGPMAVAGHSLGAFSAVHLAHDDRAMHHVLAVSPGISGPRLMAARHAMGAEAVAALTAEAPDYRDELERKSALPALTALDVPFALVTGSEDGIVPVADAERYFAAAPRPAFFGLLEGENHCPAGPVAEAMLTRALRACGL